MHGNLYSLGASLRRLLLLEVLVSSASRGLAPREGLELAMSKLGRTKPLMKPHYAPQTGKSEYPRSQNADTAYFEN